MILDVSLVGEFAAIITTTMQAIKAHPKIRGSQIPWISGVVGAAIGLTWYLVSGGLDDGHGLLGVDWANIFRGFFNGIAGAVTANAGFNIQKFLPDGVPKILPTSGEMNEQALKEAAKKQQDVVNAVTEGAPPEKAKEIAGLEKSDPPPTEVLEKLSPIPDEVKPIG